jgi:hypothetical protein
LQTGGAGGVSRKSAPAGRGQETISEIPIGIFAAIGFHEFAMAPAKPASQAVFPNEDGWIEKNT